MIVLVLFLLLRKKTYIYIKILKNTITNGEEDKKRKEKALEFNG